MMTVVEFHNEACTIQYSGVPIMQAGSIKQAGRIFTRIQINEQDLIRASRVEKWTFSLYKW